MYPASGKWIWFKSSRPRSCRIHRQETGQPSYPWCRPTHATVYGHVPALMEELSAYLYTSLHVRVTAFPTPSSSTCNLEHAASEALHLAPDLGWEHAYITTHKHTCVLGVIWLAE